MDDLQGVVSMSTSGSVDPSVDVVANSGEQLIINQHLTEALRKLHEGGYGSAPLPHHVQSPLWNRFADQYTLALQELVALQNYACPVGAQPTTRPRGVLHAIVDHTLYRITDKRIRASFTITSTVDGIQYKMMADLMVDPGANTDLKLPARKVMELRLTPAPTVSRTIGSTNHTSYALHFNSVLVTATLDRDGVAETKSNWLDVKCDKNEYDALVAEREAMAAAQSDSEVEVFSTPSPNQSNGTDVHATGSSTATNPEPIRVIQLTPTRHRPAGSPNQQAVIGIDGLAKLHLHLNCQQMQLEVEEDELIEDEEN